MKLSELPGMIGKVVTVELEQADDNLPVDDVTGNLLAVNGEGLVIKTKSSTTILSFKDIADVREASVSRKIVRRALRFIPEPQARQHLLDRHALPWSLIKHATPLTALRLHEKIDHTDLGHRHRASGEGGDE